MNSKTFKNEKEKPKIVKKVFQFKEAQKLEVQKDWIYIYIQN